jgi:hypothetical protein
MGEEYATMHPCRLFMNIREGNLNPVHNVQDRKISTALNELIIHL